MKTSLFYTVSIDGFIANSDGKTPWPTGAWTGWCNLVNTADNVVLGRTTYEELIQDPCNSDLKPDLKILVSTRELKVKDSSWIPVKSPGEAMEILQKQKVLDAIVGGGRNTGLSFLREGLVDELILDMQPVSFGRGLPLFGEALEGISFQLTDSQRLNGDAVRLRYKVLHSDH